MVRNPEEQLRFATGTVQTTYEKIARLVIISSAAPMAVTELGLENHRVGNLPTLFYVPDYISAAEEAQLLSEVRSSKAKWTQVEPEPSNLLYPAYAVPLARLVPIAAFFNIP